MKEGKLVPDDVVLNLVKQAMKKSTNKKFLLDGFPRTLEQVKMFENEVGPVSLALYLRITEEAMVTRVMARAQTAGKRANDSKENVEKQIVEFKTKTRPIVDYLESTGKVRRVDALKPVEEVYENCRLTVMKLAGMYTPPTVVFMMGGPGAGKGTQCTSISKELGFTLITTGDLLRQEVAAGSELGKQVESIMKEGKLVPDDVVLNLVKQAMKKSTNKKFLLDGFPRTLEQARMFENSVAPVSFVTYIRIFDKTMEARLTQHAKTSNRSDLTPGAIAKQIECWNKQTHAVIEYYDAIGKVRRVNGEQSEDSVHTHLLKEFSH